jgi:uncharacterized membrane protein SpoIIM required for sporulation
MKETRFIAQNKEKWLESENLLKDRVKDPEKLTNLFIQVIDDLSFSRTYYPNRSVRVYLNKLGREYFNIIYSHKKGKRNRFNAFWLDELPQIVYQSRKQLLISLVVFLFAAAIGIFSSIKDPQFTSTILGESYVAMTKENIEKGDPMAVYKSGHQIDMFLQITVNNIRVAFTTYVFGIFLSLGTIMILLYNGIMVGCFQYFFLERGLFAESALSIWLHGTLEISSIILAGGAGLVLGSGLIFPGTYSRLQAFQISAIRSLKLMLGITPIFIVAGIIESFLTRYTEVSDVLKLFLILISAFFIIGYFVVYPWMKSRNGFDTPLDEARLPPTTDETLFYDRIKNNAELIKDGFIYYKKFSAQLLGWITFVTLLMALAELILYDPIEDMLYVTEWYKLFTNSVFYGIKTPSAIFLAINSIATSLIIYRVMIYIDGDAKKTSPRRYNILAFLQTTFISAVFYCILFFLGGWGNLLAILTFYFFLLLAFTQHFESKNIFLSFARMIDLSGQNFGKVIGLQLIVLLLLFSFLMILSAPVLYYNTTILQWNFAETDDWAKKIIRFLEIFIKLWGFNLTLPIIAATASYLYFSLKEITETQHLMKSIENMGTKFSKRRQ